MSRNQPYQSGFWFPSMSVAEISEALSGWGLSVSHEQIVKPSSDFVLHIYSTCLQQVTSISEDRLAGPVQSALATLMDSPPDIYANALAHNFLVYHITRFASATQFPDFSSRDIAYPDPERTRSILSAFVNYVKFSEQCADSVSSIRNRSTHLVQEQANVNRELKEVQENLDALRKKQAADEPKCEELQEENRHVGANILANKERQDANSRLIEDLKAIKAEILRKHEKLANEITQLSDHLTRTRSRIVQSPDRIKQEISHMGNELGADKNRHAELEAKIRGLQAKIAGLEKIEEEVKPCMTQLQLIEKEQILLDQEQKQLAYQNRQYAHLQTEMSDLKKKKQHAETQLKNAHERHGWFVRNREERARDDQQSRVRLQKEYEQLDEARKENDKQLEGLRVQADEIERQRIKHLRASERELSAILKVYSELRGAHELFIGTLAERLNFQMD